MAKKAYRVLVDANIEQVWYDCNDVAVIEEKVAKAYVEAGSLDGAASAVEYAKQELGAKPIDHADRVKAKAEPETADGNGAEDHDAAS